MLRNRKIDVNKNEEKHLECFDDVELSCVVEVYKATQLNSTQLNCQLSIRRRRVGSSERLDPVEVVCGS